MDFQYGTEEKQSAHTNDTTSNDTTSPSDIAAEIIANYKWNFVVNSLESAFHGLSIGFVTYTTILPLYVAHLTNNPLLIGLVTAIAGSAYLLPQLLVANFIEQMEHKKPLVVRGSFFLERLPFLGLALSSWILTDSHPILALIAFFLAFAWHGLGEGVVVIAWRDMLAKLFPVNRRGRFFGVANFSDSLMGVVGAGIATHILARLEFPDNFTLLFALAFGVSFIAMIFLAMNREPVESPTKPTVSQRAYFRQLPSIMSSDRTFRNYLLSRVMFGLGRMGIGFASVFAVVRWALRDSKIGEFTVILLIAQTTSSLILGFVADWKGHKINIVIGLGVAGVAMLLLAWAPTVAWLYLIFPLIGVGLSTELLSSQVIVFEFAPEKNRPTYIGLASTMSGIFGGISPLVGGWIASTWSYELVFVISGILLGLTLMFTVVTVREPRLINVTTSRW